jgi:hypothetical protein
MPGMRSTARSSPASTRRRMALLEQENTRLRQMYLKLSMEHSALQEMVLAMAMRQEAAGPAAPPARAKIR